MLDGEAELLLAGHLHQWGYLMTEQRHGRVTHAARLRGYKFHDDYARAGGFPQQDHGASAFIIINPLAPPTGRVMFFWDLEMGCRVLNLLRQGV